MTTRKDLTNDMAEMETLPARPGRCDTVRVQREAVRAGYLPMPMAHT